MHVGIVIATVNPIAAPEMLAGPLGAFSHVPIG
jgi:hypothetical protein